jgi:hypothetical protein
VAHTHIRPLMAGLILSVVSTSTEAASLSKSRNELWTLIDKTARIPSEADRVKRSDLLDAAQLPLTAMIARADNSRYLTLKESDLQKLGETALIFQSLDFATTLQKQLQLPSGSSGPPSLRAAWAAHALRQGDLGRAQSLMPQTAELRKLSSNAEFKAQMANGALRWALGSAADGADAWSRVPQNSAFDMGLVYLQKARAAYEQGRMGQVLEELINVPRSSSAWHPGLLISSWAAYRLGDSNLALGLLMSVHSPYLAPKFAPESYVLEAATFYKLCHFQSAARSLQTMRSNYKSFSSALSYFDRQFSRRYQGVAMPLEYARGVRRAPTGIGGRDWSRLMDGLLNSEALSDVDRLLLQAQREKNVLAKVTFEKNRFAQQVVRTYQKSLDELRAEAMRAGLRAVRSRLADMKTEVSTALESALAVEVEINSRLRERLMTGTSPQMKDVDFDTEIRKGFEFWPFQGEYWRDEVGSYVFATTDVCGGGPG